MIIETYVNKQKTQNMRRTFFASAQLPIAVFGFSPVNKNPQTLPRWRESNQEFNYISTHNWHLKGFLLPGDVISVKLAQVDYTPSLEDVQLHIFNRNVIIVIQEWKFERKYYKVG